MKTKKKIDITGVPMGFYYRDSDHKYFLDGKSMTGCTTILGVLAKPALIPWAARMAVDYIKDVAEYVQNNHEDRDGDYYIVDEEQLNEAKTAYAKKRDEGAQKGTDTHALVETYIGMCIEKSNGLALAEDALVAGVAEKIAPFIGWSIANNIRFIASEAKLYSKELFIAGTADFIFEKDGKRYIGDIKTYKKIWDRTPFYQCAGYALMWEEMNEVKDPTDGELVRSIPGWYEGELEASPTIAGYVIFNLPKERSFNEKEDVLWSFDIEGDTRAFKACVEIYRQNANFIR